MPYSTDKPLLQKLPERGFKDNSVVAALTAPVDIKYTEVLTLLESMPGRLTADGCPIDMLDFLAHLVGMSGQYWDTSWMPNVKREFIRNAAFLWRLKGTKQCIQKALDIHNISYKLWLAKNIALPSKLPGTFGIRSLKFFVRLPLTYGRTSYQYLEAQRILDNYKPVVVSGRVCYEAFKLGYSKLGEPIFI